MGGRIDFVLVKIQPARGNSCVTSANLDDFALCSVAEVGAAALKLRGDPAAPPPQRGQGSFPRRGNMQHRREGVSTYSNHNSEGTLRELCRTTWYKPHLNVLGEICRRRGLLAKQRSAKA